MRLTRTTLETADFGLVMAIAPAGEGVDSLSLR